MNGQTPAPPGWYPLPNDPLTERYWNGTGWSEHHRPRPATPFVAPPSGGPSNTGRIVLAVILGILLILGGCVASAVFLVGSTVDTYEQLTVTTLQDDGRPGSITSPRVFGESHTRQPSFSGSGWTLSIDEVRSLGDGCLAVLGTATLDQLEGERTVSFASSFPEIALVRPNERLIEPAECNQDAMMAEDRRWAQDLEMAEGSTFTWFETFGASPDDYRYVSVSGTIYEQG